MDIHPTREPGGCIRATPGERPCRRHTASLASPVHCLKAVPERRLPLPAVLFAFLVMAQDPASEEPAPPTPAAPIPYQTVGGGYQPSSIRPFEMPRTAPAATEPAPGVLDRIPDRPVLLDQYTRSYEADPDARERFYQSGVQRNFDLQQSRMGALDGAWTVRTATGAPFMTLMLNDTGRPGLEIEGAWRRVAPAAPLGSGLLMSVRREGEQLVVLWIDRSGETEPAALRLTPQGADRWTGTLTRQGAATPVTMGR